jgi:WD40 repeat protein
LETITLKALAKDPAERYASAGELATDLCRYLEDRPILARRPTARQRLARWARRHRPVVVTAAAGLALLIVAAVIGLAVNNAMLTWERNQTLRERNQTLSAEREGRHRLEQSLVAQAQAHRWTGQLSARADGLDALEQAVRLAAGLDLGESERLRLRNEAVALMALPDFRVVHGWDGFPAGSRQFAIDADFRRYARSDEQNVVSVRRVKDDCELFTLQSPKEAASGIGQLKFSPCGRHLARRADVVVWDLERRAPVITVAGSFDFAFRPDGGAVAISHRDGTVRIHELPGGTELGRFTAPNLARREPLVSFNNSGTVLAVHDYPAAEVQLWDPESRTLVDTVATPGKVMATAWHPNGRQFTIGCSGRQGEMYHYDLDAARWSGPWLGHQSACVEFAFDPSGGLLASKGWDSTTRLWAVEDGRQLLCLPERADATFARDGRLAIRHGKRVTIIETGDRATYRRVSFPGMQTAAVAFDVSRRFLIAAGTAGLVGWDLAAGREVPAAPGPAINTAFFDSVSGDLITVGAAGLQRRRIESSDVPAGQVRFGHPERLGPEGWRPHEVVLSGDGQTLVALMGQSLALGKSFAVVVDRATEKVRAPLEGPINMRFLAVSRDGSWASAGSQYGNEVRVWDARTGDKAHSIPHAAGVASRVAFSPDGRGLLVGHLGEYCMLEVGTWTVQWRAATDASGDVHAELGLIAFTPDSTIAAVRNSRSVIRLLDVVTGAHLADLTAPDLGLLNNLCFDSAGRRLAAVMEDGTVHLWDLPRVRERLAALGLDWAPPTDAGH